MQRIGLFGGSFNPIHNGHLHLAQTARESLGLDQVVLIPANVSPFKQQNPDMASGADRLAMCRLAAETLLHGRRLRTGTCRCQLYRGHRAAVPEPVSRSRTGAAGGQRYVPVISEVALLARDSGNGSTGRGVPHGRGHGGTGGTESIFIAIWQNFFVSC